MRTIALSEDAAPTPPKRAETARLIALFEQVGRLRSLRDPIAAACEDLQLTAPQVHAVGWLGIESSLTMGELARRLCISEKTATGVVDRLEAAGTVVRERAAEDRRVVRVTLTPDGQGLAREIHAHVTEMLERALGFLAAPQREALFDILETLIRGMQQEADGAQGAADRS